MEAAAGTRTKTTDLVYTALCAALIAVCSWISVPAAVPFTLQTCAVFAALNLLGGKRGTTAVLVYILLGAVGLPVFSGFKGGPGVLLGTTGGYIIGFLFTGLLFIFAERLFGQKRLLLILALIAGLLVCYAFGTAWFMLVYARSSGPIGLGTALSWCVIPFVVPDLIKLAAAVLITDRVKHLIP